MEEKPKTVLVNCGEIAGIQAALGLGDVGIKVLQGGSPEQ